jgi:hypothetical protein
MASRRSAIGALLAAPAVARRPRLEIATFSIDVTPPLGSPLCYSLVVPSEKNESPLLAKGVVLYPERQRPIVLVAIDWLGIGGQSHSAWRGALARAVGTHPDRVAVHTVHQHDAPGAYADAQRILDARGLSNLLSPSIFCAQTIVRAAAAAQQAKPQPVTGIGFGRARVDRVASNRRLLNAAGQFEFQRFTACRNNPLCDAPEGLIDPELKTISFYNSAQRLASLHYYATHPMSYYGKGQVNPDFVGQARESLPGFHVYFTGAAGNIGPGKYNSGDPANRAVLAQRLGAAMEASLAAEQKTLDLSLRWRSMPVLLPHRAGADFSRAAIESTLNNPQSTPRDRASAARYLAWHAACQTKRPITLSALATAHGRLLHLPGELFVEYQLAAQNEANSLPVALAAYGDYGPMYIGVAKSYSEGGYETSAVSRVGPDAEPILLKSIRTLLLL